MKFARRTRSPATDDSTTRVPWPWASQQPGHGQPGRHRADVVDLGQLHGARRRRLRRSPGPRAARRPGRPRRGRRPASWAARATTCLVAVGVQGVERQRLHPAGARGPHRCRRRVASASGWRPARITVACRGPASRAAMATPMSEAPPRTRTDCTAPRASFIREVRLGSVGSSRPGRRRARSEHSRRSGSSRSRTARQAGSSGYMASSSSGRSRESLAR